MDSLSFHIVSFGSEEYGRIVRLREDVLRAPFGMKFSFEDIAAEKEHIHVAGYAGERLVASAALVPMGDKIQMKRVAVGNGFRGQGIGSALLYFCEQYAVNHGYGQIFVHARDTAVAFYHRHHFIAEGEYFDEISIPHLQMRKTL